MSRDDDGARIISELVEVFFLATKFIELIKYTLRQDFNSVGRTSGRMSYL